MAFTRASLLISAALVLGSAGGALAADLGDYGGRGSLKDGPMPVYQTSGPSWYVRADGGYSEFDEPEITESGIYSLIDESIDSTWSAGGGIGRYFGGGLRGDLTWDHRFEADVQANLADNGSTLPGVRHFGLKSDVFLANMYYDFDSGNRFTPYIGLGLGVTRNKTTEGTVETCKCTTATIGSGSNTHVAGAAMAGVQWKIRDRLSLDAGYRFLYLGSVDTGAIVHTGNAANVAEDPAVEDIHAHEFRFGLRYDIN